MLSSTVQCHSICVWVWVYVLYSGHTGTIGTWQSAGHDPVATSYQDVPRLVC